MYRFPVMSSSARSNRALIVLSCRRAGGEGAPQRRDIDAEPLRCHSARQAATLDPAACLLDLSCLEFAGPAQPHAAVDAGVVEGADLVGRRAHDQEGLVADGVLEEAADGGDLDVTSPEGKVTHEHWKPEQVVWAPITGMHTSENVGKGPIRIYEIELKKPGPSTAAKRDPKLDPVKIDPKHNVLAFENDLLTKTAK